MKVSVVSLFLLVGTAFAVPLDFDDILSKIRIVGGRNTTTKEIPWQATILYHPITHCGGAIINEDTILTAAHCFQVYDLSPKSFRVRVGNDFRSVGGQVYDVKKIITHPLFNYTNYHYDIAIVKLAKKLNYTERIRPIKLPEVKEPLPVGQLGLVSGWGRLEYDGPFPKVLQEVYLPILDQETCIDKYRDVTPIADVMFCAGTGDGTKDACSGDSGGPFIADNKLFGIVSFGIECALPEYPGVFTSVSELRQWVDDNMNEGADDDGNQQKNS